jgi:hypothetical protein
MPIMLTRSTKKKLEQFLQESAQGGPLGVKKECNYWKWRMLLHFIGWIRGVVQTIIDKTKPKPVVNLILKNIGRTLLENTSIALKSKTFWEFV